MPADDVSTTVGADGGIEAPLGSSDGGAGGIEAAAPGDATSSPDSSEASGPPPGSAPPPDPSTASSYLINTAHTGAISDPALRPPLVRAWAVDLNGDAWPMRTTSYPLVAGGLVYTLVGAQQPPEPNSSIVALDVATGATVWGPVDGHGAFTHALDGGRLFTLCADGTVRAYDASTGAALWSNPFGDVNALQTIPTAYRGIVYVSGTVGVLAFDEVTGAQLWKDTVDDYGDQIVAPTVTDDGVFMSYGNAVAFRYDRVSGHTIWGTCSTCLGEDPETAVLAGGRLFTRGVGNNAGGILDVLSGVQEGTFDTALPLAFYGDGAYTVTPGTGTLTAFDSSTLQPRWTFTGDGGLSSTPLVVDDELYVGSSSGVLFGVDRESGVQNWSDDTGYPLSSADGQPSGLGHVLALAAAEGHLVVPAGTKLIAYVSAPDAGP